MLESGLPAMITLTVVVAATFAVWRQRRQPWHCSSASPLKSSLVDELPPELLTVVAGHLVDATDTHRGALCLLRFAQCSHTCGAAANSDAIWKRLLDQLGVTSPNGTRVVSAKLLYERAVGAMSANAAFYSAFRSGDVAAMCRLWLHERTAKDAVPRAADLPPSWIAPVDELPAAVHDAFCDSWRRPPTPVWCCAFCRHPGWQYLRAGLSGWHDVTSSWSNILSNGGLDVWPRAERWELSPCGRIARVALEETVNGRTLKGMHNAYVHLEPQPHGASGVTGGTWRMLVHDSPCPLYETLPAEAQRFAWVDLRLDASD